MSKEARIEALEEILERVRTRRWIREKVESIPAAAYRMPETTAQPIQRAVRSNPPSVQPAPLTFIGLVRKSLALRPR